MGSVQHTASSPLISSPTQQLRRGLQRRCSWERAHPPKEPPKPWLCSELLPTALTAERALPQSCPARRPEVRDSAAEPNGPERQHLEPHKDSLPIIVPF